MSEIPCHCDIVIVGAGISGASTAYHLAQYAVSMGGVVPLNIVVLERGASGEGSGVVVPLPEHVITGEDEKNLAWAHASGTAVMRSTSTIKMMTQLFAANSEDFIRHHGRVGVEQYLKLSNKGLQIERDLAKKHLLDPSNQFRELGAMYLARSAQAAAELRQEYETLIECGAQDIEWWPQEKTQAIPDCPVGTEAAIFLKNDAIINSQELSKRLLAAAVATGYVRLFEGCPEVTGVWTSGANAITELSTGARIVSKHVVVATGGFLGDTGLNGILRPCWSYLVSVGHPDLTQESSDSSTDAVLAGGVSRFSPNMYTWGFTHDWCWTNGSVRCSGEDHFSALKPPREQERCSSLASWVKESYPHAFGTDAEPQWHGQYGVYSETPDYVPIIGHPTPNSKVCYIVGCNAWGQAAMSYSASLIPGLLGYTALDAEQKDILSLISIRRFALLGSVLGK